MSSNNGEDKFNNLPRTDGINYLMQEMRKYGDDRPHSEMRVEIEKKFKEGISYEKQLNTFIQKSAGGIPLSLEEQTEAMDEAFSQYKKERKNARVTSEYTIFPEEVSEGEAETNKFLDNRKFNYQNEKIQAVQIRALANRRFWDYMLNAKWHKERVFGCCIAVLKDEAIDERMRTAASKCYEMIMQQEKKFKIDDDRRMEEIYKIRLAWEQQIKQPWDIREEIIRNQWLDIDKLEKDHYTFE